MSGRILVIGGTGTMGARVVARLLTTTLSTVTVLSRSPDSPRVRALAESGGDRVIVRPGNLDDPNSIRDAMRGVGWVFCNTDFFATASVPGEIGQGITALEAARDAGVERFVYSSLDSAAALTGGTIPVPHFDAKAAVAAWITAQRSDEMMRQTVDGWFTKHVSVLTTAPYYENLTTRLAPARGRLSDGRDGLIFTLPLGDSGRYPLIGLDDIAWFADFMLHSWQSWGARDLAVAADSLTGHQIARTVEDVTGTPAEYVELPLDVLQASIPGVGHDYAAMARFIQHHDLVTETRDLPMLRRIHPEIRTFADWLRASGAFTTG
ncbi:NmrA/HSCARG family protein [Kutzneria viridogrisea]|uniref:Uncharacterized protein YbjT (DUF2867 family) n=1 Tax=Kutzneria viridogrisea TaxID=47990 RepID=A0ABR6BCU6_9PSEU|nr:uncharacterized protein YbjT (DUF2867 family) [Kutzneria viridogrisea]